MMPEWDELLRIAEREVEQTVSRLPADLKARAVEIPVLYEHVPSEALIDDGLEPDILGLFVGPEFADEEHAVMPAQILLFLDNLWDFAEGDLETYRYEVRTTYMHELGHYLGLDEDELDQRGLL